MTNLQEHTRHLEQYSTELTTQLNFVSESREGGFDDKIPKDVALFYLTYMRLLLNKIEVELGGVIE